jgi:hypothetical protein
LGIVQQRGAGLFAQSGENVEHASWQEILCNLRDREHGERRILGCFEDDRIARA